MSEPKFTPGPWETWGPVDEKVATNFDDEWGVYPSGDYSGPVAVVSTEANARLIAAAPDLLEALEGILGDLGTLREGSPLYDYVQKAQAAIAKANGATPCTPAS